MNPTANSRTISSIRISCRQWIFSQFLNRICTTSAIAMPMINDTTGMRYLMTLLLSASTRAVLMSTIFPVCAFAKTEPRQQ